MGLQKIGLNVGKEIIAWTRTSSKNLLLSRPVKVNIDGLKYAPLKTDVVQFSKSNIVEYIPMKKKTFKELASKRPYIKNTINKGPATYEGLFIGHNGRSINESVNSYLRIGNIPNPRHTPQRINEIIDSAHFAMSKSKLPHDTILYRMVKDINNIPQKGEIFKESGFLSTSINPDAIGGYGTKFIEILVPKETPCIVNGSYFEVLLKDGLKFRVAERGDDFAKLVCEGGNTLLPAELNKVKNYARRIELESPKWVQEFIENNYWNL